MPKMITTSLIYQTLAVLLVAQQQATFTASVFIGPNNFRRVEPSKPPKRIINVADAPVGVPVASPEEMAKLPKSFDGRTAWSECSSLRHVSHQGSCGSCWAVVTTDVAADRLCIASKGAIQVRLSPMHLLQCCGRGDCNDGIVDFGACAGGDPWGTWRYLTEHGVVTDRCKPYPDWAKGLGIHTFESGLSPSAREEAVCRNQCTGENSSLKSFEDELHFGHAYYRLPQNEGTIRKEILEHGPVVTHLSVNEPRLSTDESYDDSVIYRCPKNGGGTVTHGVRLIGWGEEVNSVSGQIEKYWLAVNSWGRQWGNNGTFRIARGVNSCHVEEFVSTVLMKV